MNNKVFLNEQVAKKLFKNKKYGKILSAKVISEVIGASFDEVYQNIKLSSEEIAFSAKTLNSTADAVFYDDTHYFNIEINFYRNHNKKRQLSSYTYQLYLGQLHTHKDYPKIKKVIQISIDSFDYFGYNEFMYRVYFMEEEHHQIESDDIAKIHINLAYIKQLDYNNIEISGNELMKDLYFLTCNDDNKLNKLYEGDNLMKEIIKEAKKIAGTLELDLYATDEELREMDFQEGLMQGKKEGILQNKKEMVINLYNNKVPIKTIAKSANLSIDEVQEIIDEAKKIAGTLELDLYATDEELREMDFQEGLMQGKKEGILQKEKEMVINMHKDKLSLENIAKYANLTIKEVQEIIDKAN